MSSKDLRPYIHEDNVILIGFLVLPSWKQDYRLNEGLLSASLLTGRLPCDRRFLNPKSSYERILTAPPCRLIEILLSEREMMSRSKNRFHTPGVQRKDLKKTKVPWRGSSKTIDQRALPFIGQFLIVGFDWPVIELQRQDIYQLSLSSSCCSAHACKGCSWIPSHLQTLTPRNRRAPLKQELGKTYRELCWWKGTGTWHQLTEMLLSLDPPNFP